jgi:hypothetical protein
MKRLFNYIKFYLEPNGKDLRREAFISAKFHFRDKPSSNYSLRTIEFQAYQQNYVRAYRESYAKTQLNKLTSN